MSPWAKVHFTVLIYIFFLCVDWQNVLNCWYVKQTKLSLPFNSRSSEMDQSRWKKNIVSPNIYEMNHRLGCLCCHTHTVIKCETISVITVNAEMSHQRETLIWWQKPLLFIWTVKKSSDCCWNNTSLFRGALTIWTGGIWHRSMCNNNPECAM